MPIVSAAELALMRDAIESEVLPDECTLLSPTYTPDGQGGFNPAFGTVSSNVPCRLDVMAPREQQAAGAVYPFTKYVMTLPYSTTINAGYRVQFGSFTYNVVGIAPDKSWAICKRAYLEQIANG